MTATIRPPPTSASCGRVLASQVHHPTGAAVPRHPQSARRVIVAVLESPNMTRPQAVKAMINGITTRTGYTLLRSSFPISTVPRNPDTPMTRSMNESADALTWVTDSRNGRRYVNSANWPMNSRLTATMPSVMAGRSNNLKTSSVVLDDFRWCTGMCGRLAHCQASAAAAIGTVQKNAHRQPTMVPRKLPTGAAMTVAKALPPFTMANARGTCSVCTRRITIAADIDQKPPIATPMSARPVMNTATLGAKATVVPETSIRAVSESMTGFRSSRPESDEMNKLVTSANAPDIEIACPAVPSLIRRSLASGVSRLTGMNSDATRANAPSATATTAPHADARRCA